ncbi:MAG: hypothetical protein U0Q16_04810 [Bryobacteraceae bacterium]
MHLAVAHSQQHHKTLLIDGDLRRPSVHKRFNLTNTLQALERVLLDGMPWRVRSRTLRPSRARCCRSVRFPAAQPFGSACPGSNESSTKPPANTISSFSTRPRCSEFPLQMAAAADGVVIVARAGQTSRKGVASVVSTLNRLRANIVGLVLNEVHREISDTYYYYGYYGKYYRHYNTSGEKRG